MPYTLCTCTPRTSYFLLEIYLLYSYVVRKPFEASCPPLPFFFLPCIHFNLFLMQVLTLRTESCRIDCIVVICSMGAVIMTGLSAVVGGDTVGVMAAISVLIYVWKFMYAMNTCLKWKLRHRNKIHNAQQLPNIHHEIAKFTGRYLMPLKWKGTHKELCCIGMSTSL